jgi:hypothetical protein
MIYMLMFAWNLEKIEFYYHLTKLSLIVWLIYVIIEEITSYFNEYQSHFVNFIVS